MVVVVVLWCCGRWVIAVVTSWNTRLLCSKLKDTVALARASVIEIVSQVNPRWIPDQVC